jgi:hypothetical protein
MGELSEFSSDELRRRFAVVHDRAFSADSMLYSFQVFLGAGVSVRQGEGCPEFLGSGATVS